MDIVDFDAAMGQIAGKNAYLMLGNGFSIAVKPDIFTYGSLYDNAVFSKAPRVPEIFQALGTQDFEVVIRHLLDSARIVEVYRPGLPRLAARLRSDADAIKDALVEAIARRHPDRPYDIDPQQYAECRKFLSRFRHIYTLNYDVLLYWALMQSEVDELQLQPDDGFRHPEDNPEEPYVSWQQSHSPTVHYMHGALHLFDAGREIIKYTWSKTDIPIVDQIRKALEEEKYPLFVAEGSSVNKWRRILHNAYLHKAVRSFESCAGQGKGAFVVYGHSLADNDRHILRLLARGSVSDLLVSIYGDPGTDENKAIASAAEKLVEERQDTRPNKPLKITFYDASSARVWG